MQHVVFQEDATVPYCFLLGGGGSTPVPLEVKISPAPPRTCRRGYGISLLL
jgi:hypothetical protein